jgi:folate-binding protein YgfZ
VPDEGRGLDLARTDATDDDQQARQWMVRDICAGLVWLSPPVSEQFLPQSLGLEDRGGLSYKKGCYPGQEVVARVHYLGRAKERLSGFRLAGAGSADDVLLDDQGERIGRVLTCLGTGPETIGLAVTRIDAPMDCNVHSNGLQGRLCDPAELC